MSDSQRADELMHSVTRLQQMLKTIRAKTANDVFELALKVKRQGPWHIGGFIGEVMEEWEYQESKR